MKCLFIIMTMLSLSAEAAPKKKTLRFSVSSTWTMPFGEIKDGVLVRGFMYDFAKAISDEMKLEPEFVVLPRNRTEEGALKGSYDIRCHLTKKWVTDPSLFLWSDVIFDFAMVIVGNADSPQPKSIDDLKGKTIGTVLGYVYPELDKAFSKGTLVREDTESQIAVYQKLAAGRNSYGVGDKLSYDYFKNISGNRLKFAKWELELSLDQSTCAILKKSKIGPQKIKLAIDKLNKNGAFIKILDGYIKN